ncbi:hypothetical protein, partial [uncultured Halomonas sp.]|uniref:hypothetical protein n=1 Tax=uncultured Halomonas sp. TaxID=173971 RepID=UPI002622F735
TQIGRFFFKYQKFGTQVSRLFWQQRIKPALELTFDKNATAADRVDAYLDILHYIGTGVAAGFINRKVRSILFGMAFVGPDWDEILERFADDDNWQGWLWLADMAFHSAMSAGSIFGFFGSPMQSVIDFRDGQRVKNPMEPPGFAVFQGIQSLGVKFWQQGGYLSVPDVRDAVLREVSLPRVADRTAQSALNAIGADLDRTKLEMNRRDVGYIRGAARRWADVEGIEARASGSFSPGSTENTPANNRIHDAVRIGDQARARQLILDELQGLSVDERRSRLRSIRATLRARHPLRLAGNTMNQEQQDAFKRWASQSLPPSRWETIQEVTNTYDRTLEGALWRIQ